MRPRRPAPRHISALISAFLCCLLVAVPAASALQGGNGARGAQAKENHPTKGAPGQNLPNLDEVRRRGPANPRALPPVPSKLKKCPPDEPNCNAKARGAGAAPADAGSHATPSLSHAVFSTLVASLTNPYAGVLLASSDSVIPEPPSGGEDTPTPPAAGWLASLKGFFGVAAVTPAPEGALEPVSCEYISGWAWDSSHPTTPVMVALFDGDQLVTSVRADRYRADLVAQGKGDGRHGFRIPVPDSLRDANAHTVSVKILGAGSGPDPDYMLAYSPKILGPCGAPSYGGDILSAGCDVITGKAWDAGRPNTPIDVDVYVREGGVDVFSARVAADVYDSGIGVGDNRHLFRLPTPAVARDGQPHVITARPAGKDASHNFATQPAVTCAAPVYQGQFNSAACDYLTGWAWDSTRPDAPVSVEVVENGQVVAAALADTLRPDIPTADGKRHGFRIPVPAPLRDGLAHSLGLRVSGTETTLGSLVTLSCPPQAGSCGPEQDLPTTEFVKGFYTGVLARQPRPPELQYWNDALRTAAGQGQTQLLAEARRLGRELFLQAEYAGRGRMTSAAVGDYVSDLYWGYLQRGPDAAGHEYWISAIQSGGQAGWLNALAAFETSPEFATRVASLCPTPGETVRDYDAVSDFSPLQNPDGAWSYGYRAAGGAFTAYANRANKWGVGTDTWARDTNGLFVTRNNTGATYTYPAPSVVHPPGVLNLHPGPGKEKSVVRWTAAAAGTYVISGYFKGIDTEGTTTDVAITHNGASLFSADVSGYGATSVFIIPKGVAAGETVEFSVGVGANDNYNHDSTGLAVTISPSPPAQTQPYNGVATQVSGKIEAELFDAGGEGVAYHDATPGAQGQDFGQPAPFPVPAFRQPTNVDINKAANYSNGYVVRMQAGDWMNYTVDVAQSGSYTLSAQTYYWGALGGVFHFEANGVDVTGPVQVPGGSAWVTVSKAGVQLAAGRHVLKVVCDSNGSDGQALGEVDYLRLAADADAGLVGHWKLDEGAGSSAADSSGGGNGGTLQGGASWGVARVGTAAVNFDGTDDQVQVGARPGLVLTTAATFGAWLYPTGAGSGGALGGIVVNKEGEYEIARFPDGTIQWAFANQSPGWNWVNTGYVAPLNRWTHVAVTYEGGTVNTYADGVLVHNYSGAGSIGDSLPSQNDFRVGGRQFMSQHFQGRLDDVRVYNRALSATEVGSLVASAPPDPTGNDFSEAKKDPANKTGGGGDDPLSRNFNFQIPLVSLAGRAGLDLGLSLSYNSLVWTRDAATGAVKFDADYGDPSPGFRLGLPVIRRKHRNARGENAYMLVTPSGGTVELRQVGASNTYEATDSSYLQLTEGAGLTLRAADGSQLSFVLGGYEYKPTQIKDRNGNFISVAYNAAGNAYSITDTLGRVITFTYDANGRPTVIGQNRNGQAHQWATFGYANVTMATQFADPSKITGPANGTAISALNRVSLHDGSFYAFLYNAWGQVYRVERRASDGSTAGRLLSYTEYDLQTPTAVQTGNWTDCPRFTQRKDFVKDWNGDAPAVTTYAKDPAGFQVIKNNQLLNGSGPAVDTADTVTQEVVYGPANTWKRGLVTEVRTSWQGTLRRTAKTTWAQDDESLSYPLNPRVAAAEVSDPQGNRTGKSYGYTSFGLPVDVTEWSGPQAQTLRRTHTEYNLDPAYVSRRVIGLVSSKSVYDEQGHMASKVDYTYDQGGQFLQHQGEPAQHDGGNYGASFVVGRGLMTSVRRWDVTALHDVTKSVESRAGYNTTGSAIFSRDPLGHQTSTSYADRFSDRSATNTLAYPTSVTDAGGFSSKVEYSFHTGLVTRTVDPRGAQQTSTYDSAGRAVRVERGGTDGETGQLVSGGYTRLVYSDAMDAVQTWTKFDAGKPEVCSVSVMDGGGRVRATASDFPGSQGRYRAQYTAYDIVGRASGQTNPTEVNGLWNPSGDDDAAGWKWTTQTFDWRSRPLVTTQPKLLNPSEPGYASEQPVTREVAYDGCGCAGGEVATVKGELVSTYEAAPAPAQARRTQKVYQDALGRAVKSTVLNWNGGVYSTMMTDFNALDQPVEVRSFAGASESDPAKIKKTTMSYDGHGRLWSRHQPLQGAGLVSTYAYNADDTLASVTDARGAKTVFEYDERHLVKKLKYNQLGVTSAPTDKGSTTPLPGTPEATFTYDPAGNRLTAVTVGGEGGSVTYHYDALSRLDWEERQFPGLASIFKLSYEYTLSGAVKQVTDHQGGRTYIYEYDRAGQLAAVKGTGFEAAETLFASASGYRAWGASKGMSYGNGTGAAYAYDSRGLLTQYRVAGLTLDGQDSNPQHGSDFSYHPDGRMMYASDLFTNTLASSSDRYRLHDRAYNYDLAGRLKEAYSGSEANQFVAGVGSGVDGAYRQSIRYDVWGNRTEQTGRFWSQPEDSLEVYAAGARNTAWEYDPEGHIISRRESAPNSLPYEMLRQSYDAAGRARVTTQKTSKKHPANQNIILTTQTSVEQTYDAEGALVGKKTTNQVNSNPPGTSTTYYLRSRALGGQAVAEYTAAGTRKNAYVVAGGAVLARQTGGGALLWRHGNPVTGDELETNRQGAVTGKAVLDPSGVSLGYSDPSAAAAGGGGEEGMSQSEVNSRYAQLIPGFAGGFRCALNDLYMDCGSMSELSEGEGPGADGAGHLAYGIFGRSEWGRPKDYDPQFLDWLYRRRSGATTDAEIRRYEDGDSLDLAIEWWMQSRAGLALKYKKIRQKLVECVSDLYGVELKSFSPAAPGRGGTFVGVGYDSAKRMNTEIKVVTNTTTYDSGDLAVFYNSFRRDHPQWGFRPLRPNEKALGLTLPNAMVRYGDKPGVGFSPYLNFVAKDAKYDAEGFQLIHIHELGHALKIITGKKLGDEDGDELEFCVYGKPAEKK